MIKFIKNLWSSSSGDDDTITDNQQSSGQVHQPEVKPIEQQHQADLEKLQQREQVKKVRSTEKERLFDRTMKPRTLSNNEVRAQEAMKIRNPFKGE